MGIIDESDLLVKVHRDSTQFNDPVQNGHDRQTRNAFADGEDR